MAQTKERTQPAQPAAAKSSPKPTTKSAPAKSSATAPSPARNWLARLRPPLTNAPGPDGKPRQRAGGTIFKSFFGILIWFVASQFIMYGLLLLDGALRKPGQLPPLEASHLFPPNTPLLGWITPFLLLYGGAVIGLWFLLIRFNLIPRDFFGARAQAQQRAQKQAAASSGASTGPRKTRTQRRYSETQAQAQTTAKGGKGNGKTAAKPVAKVSETPRTTSASAGTHDVEYDRVRSADRTRRRRVSKR